MRGSDETSGALFSYVDLEARVRPDHPLRPIRQLANEALAALQADFAGLYSGLGRPSIPPERLLEATLPMAFYSVRSERLLEHDVAAKFLAEIVAALRERAAAPHIAQTRDHRRRSAVDGRTTRHAGYEVSQRIRKRVEEIFGWTEAVGCFRKTRLRGQARTQLAAHLVAAAYNLLRMARLVPAAA